MAAFALALTLSACASTATAPTASGTEVGGVVPLSGINSEQAALLARAHCAKYGRIAHTLANRPDSGGQMVFECI